MNRLAHLLIALAAAALAGAPAMAVEQPAYQVALRDGAFEVRDYPRLVVAETIVDGDRDEAANAAFRILAGYIFGGNQPKQKIAMTAPVTQTSASGGEKIAMTAPITQTSAAAGQGPWTVRFVMPAAYRLDGLPAPNDPRVTLTETPAQRVAAVRFSWFATPGALAEKTAALEAFMARQGLSPVGPATYAFYDPPWTAPFLRRNEVMIPLAAAESR